MSQGVWTGVAGRAESVWDRWCRRLARSLPAGGETVIVVVASLFAVAGAAVVQTTQGPTGFTAFMDVGLALGAIYGAVVVHRSFDSPRHRWLVAAWYLGGVVGLFGLYTWANLPTFLDDPGAVTGVADWYVLYGNLGGILGLIAGLNRARAAQNRQLVTDLEAKNDSLEFINHLLRHEVLNSTQNIHGYADLVATEVDDEDLQAHLDTITDASMRVADLVEDVRVLMDTVEGSAEPTAVDVSAVVTEEVAQARERHPGATFHADVAEDAVASGNQLVGPVVANLLQNAVVHNEGPDPTVEVTVSQDDDAVRVRVADDGPGIPQSLRESVFDRGAKGSTSDGMGIGLYLVRVLVDAFEGSVTVESDVATGAAVTVSLPRAGPPGTARPAA